MYCNCYLLLLLINHLLRDTIAGLEEHFWDKKVTFDMDPSEHKAKMIKFNNGQKCPMLGLGTWQFKHNINETEKKEIYELVKNAIDIGYRHIDCASLYNNEEYVGKAIGEKIKEGVIKRKDIFVTSKLWNNKHHPKDVEGELRKSLKSLGLNYLDLYLIHWPFATIDDPMDKISVSHGANISYLNTWKAMERCVHLGLTKSIGVANFNTSQMAEILKIAKIKPVVNQVENHPYLTQNILKEFCEEHGVLLTAYGALGSPYRSPKNCLMSVHIVQQLAYKYDRSVAQILLKFQVQRGIIVLTSSSNPYRLRENFEIWDFDLSTEEIHLLQSLNRHLRFCLFESAKHLEHYPFREIEYE